MLATAEEIVAALRAGDSRALARAISLVEDEDPRARRIVELLFPFTGGAYVLGVTGSPGAGKSTLVDQLVRRLTDEGKRVGVIAVDPSSPFTGGALLGDRIRMSIAAEIPSVFIRSMATRGALGGVAPRTAEAIFCLDAAGFDYVIVETVGVGQAEVEIVKTADAVVVVLVPGMGDAVQALKAGILEIADVFALNKADAPGVDRLEKELFAVLALGANRDGLQPKIVRTISTTGSGIPDLVAAVAAFRAHADLSGIAAERRNLFLRETLERQIAELAKREVMGGAAARGTLDEGLRALAERREDPFSLADRLLKASFKA